VCVYDTLGVACSSRREDDLQRIAFAQAFGFGEIGLRRQRSREVFKTKLRDCRVESGQMSCAAYDQFGRYILLYAPGEIERTRIIQRHRIGAAKDASKKRC